MILALKDRLNKLLKESDECWIAVGMMSSSGLELIKESLKTDIRIQLLVGVALPTPVGVLEELKILINDSLSCKVYDANKGFFHPKMYVFRKDESYSGFVGSANFTEGGMKLNQELSIEISNADAKELIAKYFVPQFNNNGLIISDDLIEGYKLLQQTRIEKRREEKEAMLMFKKHLLEPIHYDKVNFDEYFFKADHFKAFESDKPNLDSADDERTAVADKLRELHSKLYPIVIAKKWDIHQHPQDNHLHSTTLLRQAREINIYKLPKVWLHYGKSQDDLKLYADEWNEKNLGIYSKDTFINHIRFQVVVSFTGVDIWLVIGKAKGSRYDRNYLKDKLRGNNTFQEYIFSQLKELGDEFYISVNDDDRLIESFENSTDLYNFIKKDNIENYFWVGKSYTAIAPQLKEATIANTIISDFEKLMPLYERFRHRPK